MPRISDSQGSDKPAIVFNEVDKAFKISHTQSFKQSFIAMIRRRERSTGFKAVDDLSFEVPEGQSIALMGRNGSGKSTTLKLLSGVMEPDAGWIRTRGRIAGLLEVGAGFHPDLTGRQNVYLNAAILGMSKEETDARFDQILEFSEIGDFIDTEVKRYSSGMYSRLGFSVAVHTELDTLLVDEVLSVGDAQFRKKCETKMLELQAQGKTMFIVSHNASQVKKLCTRGIVLDRGKMIFDGPIEEAVERLRPAKPSTRITIPDAIMAVYERYPARYGAPAAEAVPVEENGGGVWQQFEKGIITSSRALEQEKQAFGLTKGAFLSAYLEHGGPAGPWGFLAGKPQGDFEEGEDRTLRLQNGDASYSLGGYVTFESRGS